MKKDNNILDEIREIAPILSKIPRTNPFKVPDNYFEDNASFAADCAINLSQDKEVALPAALLGLKKNYLKVPDAYFENLPAQVLQKVTTLPAEEEVDANLKHLRDDSSYSLPEGYFEGFSSRLMERIKEEELESSPILDEIKEMKTPFSVPNGYFENFSARLKERIEAEEGEKVAVPAEAAGRVIQMDAAAEPGPAKRSRGFVRTLTAVAAVLIMFMIGMFVIRGTDGAGPILPGTEDPLADNFDLKAELNKLSDADFSQLVQGLEIDDFSLMENVEDIDIFTLTKDSELRKIQEYLLDEIDDELLKDYI